MTEVRTIARQIQKLEIYLNNLVSALTRGELPVNLQPVTQIFDNTISTIAPILNLSEDRFVEIYNDIPQILTAYAINVTLSEDSYRKINDRITFNRFHRGNYWIISTQELIDKAWLVPNPLKNLSLDRMPSLSASFDRDIINKNRDSDFHAYFLVAPALVQILPIVEPLTWKLLERGRITNSQIQKPTATIAAIENLYEQLGRNNYRQNRLEYDLDRSLEYLAINKDIIALQNKKIIALKLQVKSLEVNKNIDLRTRLEELETKNEYHQSVISHMLNIQRDDIDRLKEAIPQVLISLEGEGVLVIPSVSVHQEITSEYYHNISHFAVRYQPRTASLNKDSINLIRGNEDKTVILQETNRGSYWIFNFDDITYLVPVEGKYINQHGYTTTTSIFECHNYTPDYQKIQLIKPAIVSIEPNTNPQTWRLQQQGELVFL